MSILDDAIREHLELIRRHGATDSEVKRLEDEAFGPPTRPDEADFPEPEEGRAASEAGVATEEGVAEPGPEDLADEDATTLLPTELPEESGEPTPAPPGEAAAPQPPEGLFPEPEAGGDAEAEQPEHDEPVAEVHPIVEGSPEGEEQPSDEMSVPAEEGTSLYDHAQDEDLEVDLDLDIEEEPPAAEPPSEDHDVAEPEGAMPLEPPIESLDTVEHPFPDEITEGEEEPPSDEHPAPEEPAPPESHEGEEEGDGEDVLADTPEFLKDAPEDDELWFEQGEPKDFDF